MIQGTCPQASKLLDRKDYDLHRCSPEGTADTQWASGEGTNQSQKSPGCVVSSEFKCWASTADTALWWNRVQGDYLLLYIFIKNGVFNSYTLFLLRSTAKSVCLRAHCRIVELFHWGLFVLQEAISNSKDGRHSYNAACNQPFPCGCSPAAASW